MKEEAEEVKSGWRLVVDEEAPGTAATAETEHKTGERTRPSAQSSGQRQPAPARKERAPSRPGPDGWHSLEVTKIGEFIRHRSCERRLKLESLGDEIKLGLPFFDRVATTTLDPILKQEGKKREEEWERQLVERHSFSQLCQSDSEFGVPWADFVASLGSLERGQLGFAREVSVEAPLGEFRLNGRIDFVLVLWREGKLVLRLAECKASRRDQTYHRIQVATYRRLLRHILEETPVFVAGERLAPEAVEVCVVRIEEETNESQDMLAVTALDAGSLAILESDVERLLAEDGSFKRIFDSELEELEYQLDDRCNDCFYAVHCFPESARLRKLELLGLSPSEIRVLKQAGVADLTALSEIDLDGPAAATAARAPGMALDMKLLKTRAVTRLATLPGAPEDSPQVVEVRASEFSLLPEHEHEGRPLIRVYLAVDYDYSENRLGAISAHVTASPSRLLTSARALDKAKKRWETELQELRFVDGKADRRPLNARTSADVVAVVAKPGWVGDFESDCRSERELIDSFFVSLVEAIQAVAAPLTEAPLHFYVWDQSEIRSLIDACMRLDPTGEGLLSRLRALFSSRGHREQVIYTALGDELSRRFATGLTGSGPLVNASLDWGRAGKKGFFSERFRWQRKLGAQSLDLNRLFSQDLFDFSARLHLKDGHWLEKGAREDAASFEIRGRFRQSLTAPYFRAYWGTLERPAPFGDLDEDSKRLKDALKRYWDAAFANKQLESFLSARTQSLRWMEERMGFKNKSITKPLVDLNALHSFSLDVEGVAGAALDFLRLDHHVKMADWTSAQLLAPARRVALGRSLPLKEVKAVGAGLAEGRIDHERADRALSALRSGSNISEGSFVRLTPCDEDLERGQTINQLLFGGKTCVVESVDWESGLVRLSTQFAKSGTYTLHSAAVKDDWSGFDYATLDESPADFTAGVVEKRLTESAGRPAYAWLDPLTPMVPPQSPPARLPLLTELASADFISAGEENFALAPDQRQAALDGLAARIQLLQGPPGTGKTQTTAAALLLRVLARRLPGDIVLVAANTHTAVDTLLERVDALQDDFAVAARELGLELPPLTLAKVQPRELSKGRIEAMPVQGSKTWLREHQDSVLIIGGTTNRVLKLADELDSSALFSDGFKAQTLVVDEASMMVFPHLLAIASCLDEDGELMLAGDHRQLSPIVSHDWEKEDRDPAVTYTPFASAYEAVRSLAESGHLDSRQLVSSSLSYTFRLPPDIRRLIDPVYRQDGIELAGQAQRGRAQNINAAGSLADLWAEDGVYLVVHDERQSQQANEAEARLVEAIIAAAPDLEPGSVGVVTPHRAQRALLKEQLAAHYGQAIDVIDTVERLQGGERETIFVSACASDPSAISARAEFLLNLNRANVAFSRPKRRLVVVVSETLLDHIPADLELYESALLWKTLRDRCRTPLCLLEVEGPLGTVRAKVLTSGS